jgi:hypothetical protein
MQLGGLNQFKNPMTSSGINPMTSEVKREAKGFSKILLQIQQILSHICLFLNWSIDGNGRAIY